MRKPSSPILIPTLDKNVSPIEFCILPLRLASLVTPSPILSDNNYSGPEPIIQLLIIGDDKRTAGSHHCGSLYSGYGDGTIDLRHSLTPGIETPHDGY